MVEQAIENLQQAINLNPDEYQERAKTDSAFENLREDERFQALIQEESDWEEGETDVEKDTILQTQSLSQRPAKIDIKHLDSETVASLRASGKPFNAEEDKPTQAEILADIRRDRSFDPAEFGLPDSLTLLREDRNR